MSAPEPGWYPDPEERRLDRYWDGSAWGEERRYAPATGNLAAGIGLVLSIVGLVAVVVTAGLLSVAGVVVSSVALARARRIRRTAGTSGRRGVAVAGLAVGIVGVLVAAAGVWLLVRIDSVPITSWW